MTKIIIYGASNADLGLPDTERDFITTGPPKARRAHGKPRNPPEVGVPIEELAGRLRVVANEYFEPQAREELAPQLARAVAAIAIETFPRSDAQYRAVTIQLRSVARLHREMSEGRDGYGDTVDRAVDALTADPLGCWLDPATCCSGPQHLLPRDRTAFIVKTAKVSVDAGIRPTSDKRSATTFVARALVAVGVDEHRRASKTISQLRHAGQKRIGAVHGDWRSACNLGAYASKFETLAEAGEQYYFPAHVPVPE